MERLLKAGASLDTRLLSLGEAVQTSTVETVRWLLSHGARVNAWAGARHGPLHALLVLPGDKRPDGKAAVAPMLELLLKAGADPNAKFDGGRTLLTWCGTDAIRILLEHGADANIVDQLGNTALHVTRSAETVRALVAHGADTNALSQPPKRGMA